MTPPGGKHPKLVFLPDLVTSFNLFTGFFSILMVTRGKIREAAWLILLSMIWDSLDGNIARMFKNPTQFGREAPLGHGVDTGQSQDPQPSNRDHEHRPNICRKRNSFRHWQKSADAHKTELVGGPPGRHEGEIIKGNEKKSEDEIDAFHI